MPRVKQSLKALSLNLSPQDLARLNAVAKRRGCTASDILRAGVRTVAALDDLEADGGQVIHRDAAGAEVRVLVLT